MSKQKYYVKVNAQLRSVRNEWRAVCPSATTHFRVRDRPAGGPGRKTHSHSTQSIPQRGGFSQITRAYRGLRLSKGEEFSFDAFTYCSVMTRAAMMDVRVLSSEEDVAAGRQRTPRLGSSAIQAMSSPSYFHMIHCVFANSRSGRRWRTMTQHGGQHP